MHFRLLSSILLALACIAGEASGQSWVGGDSYALRVDKYDSFYGEARPTLWSVQRPPGVQWQEMLPPPRVMHNRLYRASNGYKAVYYAAYPPTYHAGIPGRGAAGYPAGYPKGYPVPAVSENSQMHTWRPPVVQVDPLPGDERESVVYPAEEVGAPAGVPAPDAPPAPPVPLDRSGS